MPRWANTLVSGTRSKLLLAGMGLLAATGAVLVSGRSMPILYAHQNPGGCNSNRFNISILKDRTEVQQGDTLTYTVTASNLNDGSSIACDITNASINLRLPAADGTPTGTIVNLGTGLNFPSNTSVITIGSAPYVVNVNPGVTDIVAEASGNGTLHDAPVDHAALIVKTVGTSVVTPTVTPPDASAGSASLPRLPKTGSRQP